MGAPRAMPFWAEDWVTSEHVKSMTFAERGVLIQVCAYCWLDKNCSLPGDDDALIRLTDIPRKTWARSEQLRSTLVAHPEIDGRRTHPKVWEESQKVQAHSAKRSESGKKGAAARWQSHSGLPMRSDSSPSPSPSPSPSQEEKTDSPSGKPADLPSEEAFRAADELRTSVLAWKPDHKLASHSWIPSATRTSWARDMDRMHKLDQRAWIRIMAVIAWLPSSSFWAPNIQGASKLRKQFDKLEGEMRNPRGGRQVNFKMPPECP